MRPLVRRILAALIGIATVFLATLWTLFGESVLQRYVWLHLSVGGPVGSSIPFRPDALDAKAQPYYLLLVGALLLACGLAAVLLVLVPQRDFRVRASIYLLLLVVILPANLYNYDQRDNVLPALYQAGFNVVTVFLGATIYTVILHMRATAADARILKALAGGATLLAAVVVPGWFTLMWFLWRVNLLQGVPKFDFAHLTAIGGAVSTIIAVLNYRREARKDRAGQAVVATG